jgi:hypothetical protein
MMKKINYYQRDYPYILFSSAIAPASPEAPTVGALPPASMRVVSPALSSNPIQQGSLAL